MGERLRMMAAERRGFREIGCCTGEALVEGCASVASVRHNNEIRFTREKQKLSSLFPLLKKFFWHLQEEMACRRLNIPLTPLREYNQKRISVQCDNHVCAPCISIP